MKQKGRMTGAVVLLAAACLYLAGADLAGRSSRFPGPAAGNAAGGVFRVPTQADAYTIYRLNGIRGAHAVHVNRHMNLVDYFPTREKVTRPFPIVTYDILPSYELGLDSHTWLFIAARRGLVRRITSVVPDAVFPTLSSGLTSKTHAFTLRGGIVRGYSYDIPVTVAPKSRSPRIDEPVVVTVDAGFFGHTDDPGGLARFLRSRLRDVRILVLVDSVDEPDVTQDMRERLGAFLDTWRGYRG